MGYKTEIMGEIHGITEEAFLEIQGTLAFDKVIWDRNSLIIDSERNHKFEFINSIFDLIAESTTMGGDLDIIGESPLDYSIVFFAPGKWKRVKAKVILPVNPF